MKLKGKRVAVLVGPAYEDLEFWVPLMRMQEEGADVTVVGLKAGETYVSKSGGLEVTADVGADDVSAEDFDAVLIPGGWAPDKIRRYEGVISLVRGMHEQGKIVGSICHAGLVLISAGIVRGMRAIGSLGIKDDLENAGATWVDEPAFREGNVVWGRVVPDIPAYCRELMAALG
ncbi:MAG: type 1 glutamine amidotransferase domain-containing protein [Chloroflexota bacterium]|nr:type 1 glutamine amidotransferase domain-containing protein [Chloroflexota bacterium]